MNRLFGLPVLSVGAATLPRVVTWATASNGESMSESVGVQVGRICPSCGKQASIPLIWGLPSAALMELEALGQVALGGCLVPGEDVAFYCRGCGLEWGRDTDPTADEQELAELLGVRHLDVVRGLGTGWRREIPVDEQDGVHWFVSGEPAQVAVGVQGPWFVLARPLTRWGEDRLDLQPADRREFGRDDLLHFPGLVAEAADAIASHRRRSFRWCRCCRQVRPPEWFVGASRVCERCESIAEAIEDPQALR